MDQKQLHSDVSAAEGLRLYAYKDSLGYWTGGYGHLLDQTTDWTGVVFTQEQADLWLAADLVLAAGEAAELTEWTALDTDARQNAYVELVFNMGEKHWLAFKQTRNAVLQKQWQTAHDQLLDSLWAHEVGPHRSQRIANYLLTGEFSGNS